MKVVLGSIDKNLGTELVLNFGLNKNKRCWAEFGGDLERHIEG